MLKNRMLTSYSGKGQVREGFSENVTCKLRTSEAEVRMGMDIPKGFRAPERSHGKENSLWICVRVLTYNHLLLSCLFSYGDEPLNPQGQKDLCVYLNPKKWNKQTKCNWAESLGLTQGRPGEAERWW